MTSEPWLSQKGDNLGGADTSAGTPHLPWDQPSTPRQMQNLLPAPELLHLLAALAAAVGGLHTIPDVLGILFRLAAPARNPQVSYVFVFLEFGLISLT